MAQSGGKKPSTPGKAPVPAPRRGTNPALTAQTRKVMGKHYAAKYGVRKERG